MAYCASCGKELRSGLKFCTGCGAPVPENAPQSGGAEGESYAGGTGNTQNSQNTQNTQNPGGEQADTRPLAPTIVIAPLPEKSRKQMVKTAIKAVIGSILLVAVIVGGVWATAWFMSDPFRSSPVEGVDNEKYTRMLALVNDVRNPNFDEVLDDLLTKKIEKDGEDYSFTDEYTKKFDEILGEDHTDEEELYRDCCYAVWYTEYTAKRYEWLSKNSGFLNGLYTGKANTYRTYADTLYDMLCDADSVTDFNNIMEYCENHKIIKVKAS
ncbi:MAG: zinc ribbon domain-containing protein [Clostridia bacterium]|nr:zinc ribbon domain-containing protein [Clostridia bacterium]